MICCKFTVKRNVRKFRGVDGIVLVKGGHRQELNCSYGKLFVAHQVSSIPLFCFPKVLDAIFQIQRMFCTFESFLIPKSCFCITDIYKHKRSSEP